MIIDVAIVGAGFGGLGAAVRLREAGVTNLLVLERAKDLGGTWRDNAYPGCRCDVGSDLYSFSFAPNPNWSNTYSYQAEIWRYLRDVAASHGLEDVIRYDHAVTDVAFDEATSLWRLETSQGAVLARTVVLAVGALAEPRRPDIDGLDRFAGPVVHTSAWDPAVEYAGRRVGVIGTGASAIQVVPRLAQTASHLVVFQRTAPWILPHLGHPVRASTQRLYRRLPWTQRLSRAVGYLRRELLVLGFVKNPQRMTAGENRARAFLAEQIPDLALRERLTPHYRMGCKRVLISNDYYPALRRDTVTVVTSPIDRIEPEGLRTSDGVWHPLDVLVLATGFRVTDHPMGALVRGTNGTTVGEALAGNLPNYLGTSFPGFPNLFMLAGPNTGLGHSSIIYMIESQLRYVVDAVSTALTRRLLVEPTAPAAQRWTTMVREKLPSTVWATGCASWYLNDAGVNTTIWPDFTFRYRHATRRFDPRDHRVTPVGYRSVEGQGGVRVE